MAHSTDLGGLGETGATRLPLLGIPLLSDSFTPKELNMKRIALLACIVLAHWEASNAQVAQVDQPQASDIAALFTHTCSTSQAGVVSCEAVLSAPMGTKASTAGDHITLGTYFVPQQAAEQPITRLEGTIVEVRTNVKGLATLRVQISKGVRKDRREFSVQARIVAVVSPSKVTEKWEFSPIIVDRYPVGSGGAQRQPGERTLSEDPHHVSVADSVDSPVPHNVVCSDKGDKCTDLSEVRGSMGYRTVKIEAGSLPGESILTCDKDIFFPAGTFFVLELKPATVNSP